MDVSVIVPTRNRSRMLAATLGSVLRQRDVDLEVIVVDEASTDETPVTLSALAHADPRLRIVRHDTPRGVSTARNRGAAEAHGDWVAFVDDDDLWAPDKLVRQLTAAVAAGCHWAYTGSVSITESLCILHGEPPLPPDAVVQALPRYNAIPGGGSNVVVRRTTLQRVGPFDARLRNTEDWELWIRLAKAGPPAWVCHPLMAYRVHGANASLDIDEIVRGARLIEQLHGTTVDWGRLHRWLAESYLRTGRRGRAVGELARAAFRGQAAGVASDHADNQRRRVARGIGTADGVTADTRNAWIEEAAAWVRDLEGCAP
jgi:glycosyltransferase involved in cell wall biosynthesis